MKALVMGGSRGIGRAIADSLSDAGITVCAVSSRDVDTSDMRSVRGFAEQHSGDDGGADILVLNTGGPPPKTFAEVTEDDWTRYHNQLFLGFCTILREIRVNDGGYVFLISSSVIKEPDPRLVISAAYRAAFAQVLKVQSRTEYAERDISCITIAPGYINTDRTRELVDDMDGFKSRLPMKRLGEPREIGEFVAAIVSRRIKYLSGAVINFDGAGSHHVF